MIRNVERKIIYRLQSIQILYNNKKTLKIVYKYAARTPLATVTGGKDESVAKTTDLKPLFLFQIRRSALSH